MYNFTGKILRVGNVVPCTGKVKEKCTFIVKDPKDEREIAFILFDDSINYYLASLEIGDTVKVTFTIKSREHMGNYTTSCFAINVEKIESGRDNAKSKYRQRQKDEDDFREQFKQHFEGAFNGARQGGGNKTAGSESFTDYFQGIRNAQDAKKRYRQLCKEHHPDVPGGTTEKITQINKQYERWK